MNLIFEIKRFNELSITELYQALKLRSEVFVVEQNCVYQDVDGKDEKALHLLGKVDGFVVAYSRIFKPGAYFENASIGRVAIAQKYRAQKWGHQLMQSAIGAIETNFGMQPVTISAQLYLKKFYESHGFIQLGEMYLEDEIPHIEMLKS